MLFEVVQRAFSSASAFLRTALVLLLMLGAGTAAGYCPTAQVSCHMTEDSEGDGNQAICVLACGVLFEMKGGAVATQQVALPVNHNFQSVSSRGHQTEPDLRPPRLST